MSVILLEQVVILDGFLIKVFILKYQGLEPVLEPLGTLDFVEFQELVLDKTLNLKKWFQNQFLGTLCFKKGSRIGFLES
jgi:hypothetical protein